MPVDEQARGELSVLREAVGRLADRLDTLIGNNDAARRYTLTTVITAGSIIFVALGLLGGLIGLLVTA